ncbi:MAG: T9SS type A sorting domain-containing protein [Vicingaceae bacterium]|nr:T9SS type A sorting domain-containing protein [Vicingaceae bacterium]
MKKKLLSLASLLSVGAIALHAQITLNSTHIVNVGMSVEQAVDTIPGAITIGSSGANQTWNYTSMNQDYIDTLTFSNPASFPGAASFPTANMGLTVSNQPDVWQFLNKSSAGLFVVGQTIIQQAQQIEMDFAATIITFPSTMGTTFSGSWSGQIAQVFIGQGGIDSARITRGATTSSIIDAWGNLTTPLGTFASLRQNVNETTVDTTWILQSGTWSIIDPFTAALIGVEPIAFDTTNTARWWTDNAASKFPLLEIDYDNSGTVNRVSWQKSSPTVGISELKATSDFNVYPNPAKDVVTFATNIANNSEISIMDITGKTIKTITFNTSKQAIDVSRFNAGIYFYTIRDRVSGKVLHNNKIIVTK